MRDNDQKGEKTTNGNGRVKHKKNKNKCYLQVQRSGGVSDNVMPLMIMGAIILQLTATLCCSCSLCLH